MHLVTWVTGTIMLSLVTHYSLPLRNIPEHRKAPLIFTLHKIQLIVPMNATESAAEGYKQNALRPSTRRAAGTFISTRQVSPLRSSDCSKT
jgi:hypothetical protein